MVLFFHPLEIKDVENGSIMDVENKSTFGGGLFCQCPPTCHLKELSLYLGSFPFSLFGDIKT
jgi:hypothetical protein